MENGKHPTSPACIIVDTLVVNLKEEIPGIVESNVELGTPVYNLVPIIKLEPGSESTAEEPTESSSTTISISECEGRSSDKYGIETKKSFVKSPVSCEPLSKASTSRKLASPRITYNLIPDFVDNVDDKFINIPERNAEISEYTDRKLLKTHIVEPETCRDEAFFNELEYHEPLNIKKQNIEATESVLIEQSSVAVGSDYIKKEPSVINDGIINSSEDVSSFEMIVGSCDAPILPSAFATRFNNCNTPLLPKKKKFNSLKLKGLKRPPKRNAGNGPVNSKKVNSRFTDSINKIRLAKQLRKVHGKCVTRSSVRSKRKKLVGRVFRDSANILDLPGSKERVTRSSNRQKCTEPSSESPNTSSNIQSTLLANSSGIRLSTCANDTDNSREPTGGQLKMIDSLRQAIKHNLKNPIENTGSRKVSVEGNLIQDTQISNCSKTLKNSVVDDDTLSSASNVETASEHQLATHLRTIACGDDNVLLSSRNKNKPVEPAKAKSRAVSRKLYTCANCGEGFVFKHQLVTHLSTVSCIKNPPPQSKIVIFPKATFVTNQFGETNTAPGAVGRDKSVAGSPALTIRRRIFSKQKEASGVATENLGINNRTTNSETREFTLNGFPKPIIVTNEQWKNYLERLIYFKLRFKSLHQKISQNKKMKVKTVQVFYSPKNKKPVPYRERLVFIKGKGWFCERCDQIFKNSCLLLDHKKICNVNGIFCQRCPRVFDILSDFKAHVNHCQKSVFKCPECPRVYIYEWQYEYHHSNFHGRALICTDCSPPRNFSDLKVLRVHWTNCHKEPNVTCNACGQVMRPKAIKKHLRMHDRKNLICLHCRKHFTGLRLLWQHWKTHNNTGNPAAIMCQQCGKFFELKTELVKHLKEHEGERSFICEHCGKSFFSKNTLGTHLISHKEKQFICSKCNRGFALKHQLAAHLKTIACGGDNVLPSKRNKNKQVKPAKAKSRAVSRKLYICANCEEGFVFKRQLVTHLSTVPCGKNPPSKSKSVKKKKRKSTGDKTKPSLSSKNQFTYSNCNKNFVHKCQLVTHFSTSPCGSGRVSAEEKIIETCKEDNEKLCPVPKKQFITAFENFVHKRQLAALCDSVMCCTGIRSSGEKHEVAVEKAKKSKKKLVPKNQLSCENCGRCFGRECQLAAHLGTAPCSDSALPSLKKARNVPETQTEEKSRSASGKRFFCANCNRDFVLKRQLVAHVCNSASNDDVLSASKQTKKLVRITEEAEKELKPEFSNKLLVCESCGQGFANKHQVDDHLCTAAGCSYALSPSIEAKSVVEKKDSNKKKLRSVLGKQSIRIRNLVLKQKLSRPRRSATLSFSERSEKLRGLRSPNRKI